MRRFPIPVGTKGRLQNLGNHLFLLAQPSDVGYARPSAAPDREDRGWAAMREFHMQGLVELIAILDPKQKPSIATPRSRADTTQLFVELWNHVVVEEHGDRKQIAKAIRGAEELLAKSAVATACYVNEVVTVLARPEDCFPILRRAARNHSSEWDRELLRSAAANALERVSASLQIPLVTVPLDERPIPHATAMVPAGKIQLTENQQNALERIRLMGELFFSDTVEKSDFIRPKLFPLIAGPTGVGKSFLVVEAARLLGAVYHPVTRGDWTVQHARYGVPTVYQLIELAATNSRVAVHLDECDKYSGLFDGGEWSSSLGTELWSVLDRRFPLADFFAADHPAVANMAARKMSTAELSFRLTQNLWFVGSGTWDAVFATERKSAGIGYRPSDPAPVSADSIACANTIPAELLTRFNSDMIILRYPDRNETDGLLERFGIRALAQELGINLNSESVDWQTGGMRALESLQTRLLLQRMKRQREQHRS